VKRWAVPLAIAAAIAAILGVAAMVPRNPLGVSYAQGPTASRSRCERPERAPS
jgi:hypothetical protein